ncbi:YjdF family protein [Leuconostoc gelidum subsp. gasicomitatum]|uniref:YjdF family protein n=1 Tax=Leuconostoc gasicomitatum TaxID=115778 RepID=UPI0015D7CDB9|nr:YjdF family protein [Leuconostoc gasicomitatum]MBZ5948168.1 YjdF family protein [Leuconostoc gasicomitatum]
MVTISLTIIFDAPYYKGVFEVRRNNLYSVAEINLGTSEPKLPLIHQLILDNWAKIDFFTKKSESRKEKVKINPKRLQRLARKETKRGVGTIAQMALKEQMSERKKEKKSKNSAYNELLKKKIFSIKQEKKKNKHNGH